MNRFKMILVACVVSSGFSSEISEIQKSMLINYVEQMQNTEIIKQENKQLVKQNELYYKNIAKSARVYYRDFLGKSWGEDNVKLSNKKVFTQYNDNMNQRESIDFKNGKVTFEIVSDVDEDIEVKIFDDKLQQLKSENISQAIDKDPVARLTSKYLDKKNIASKNTTMPNKEIFLDGLLKQTKIKTDDIKKNIITLKDGKKKKITSVTIAMIPKHLQKRAKRYKKQVLKNASRFDVKPSHILGTIETESYFNPLAISHVPAYGLMQIVPSSGGKDAYLALTGKQRLLSPYYLYDGDKNIELGSQYINIISKRYLKGIKDKTSLFYCSCVAYNAGIGTLIKSFTGSYSKRKEAISIINSMSSDEIYHHLRTSKRLNTEARNYVKKLKINSEHYRSWDIINKNKDKNI